MTYNSSSIPIIDVENGLLKFGNNEKFYCEMLQQLNLDPSMTYIATAVDELDFAGYFKHAKEIKSNVEWIRADRLFKVAKEIEEAY